MTLSKALPVQEILEDTNAKYRKRSSQKSNTEPLGETEKSIQYVDAFWPHVVNEITSDPDKLGLSVIVQEKNGNFRVKAEDLRQNFISQHDDGGNSSEILRLACVLSSSAVMQRVLNSATQKWASEFDGFKPKCLLQFDIPQEKYVSLRMLLPLKSGNQNPVKSNAPTLVMGGTATAISLCWNLINRIPGAYEELNGASARQPDVKKIWGTSRELMFAFGTGSLAAFVAFVSACSENTDELVWDGTQDLSLKKINNRFVWHMSVSMIERYHQILDTVADAQSNEYTGCAALYAKAKPLPLNTDWAQPPAGQESVFSELLRWVGAIADKQYFSKLPQ
jgi:hypothetical protein